MQWAIDLSEGRKSRSFPMAISRWGASIDLSGYHQLAVVLSRSWSMLRHSQRDEIKEDTASYLVACCVTDDQQSWTSASLALARAHRIHRRA